MPTSKRSSRDGKKVKRFGADAGHCTQHLIHIASKVSAMQHSPVLGDVQWTAAQPDSDAERTDTDYDDDRRTDGKQSSSGTVSVVDEDLIGEKGDKGSKGDQGAQAPPGAAGTAGTI